MLSEEKVEKIKTLAQDVCLREGCSLYDIEFTGSGRHRVLRIYIDSNGPDAVSVDHCANVSRGLSLQLDVEDVVPGGQYELEVSSPGLERQLREKWHFEKALGKTVSLAAHNPPTGHKGNHVKGVLSEVSDTAVRVNVSDTSIVEVEFSNIKKAQTVFEFIKNEKRGKNG